MSVYICNRKTLLKVLTGIKRYTEYSSVDDNITIFKLADLNNRSVNTRYHENAKIDPALIEDLTADDYNMMAKFDDKDILWAVREYQYQSCEVENCENEEAYFLCNWVKNGMLEKYVGKAHEGWGA